MRELIFREKTNAPKQTATTEMNTVFVTKEHHAMIKQISKATGLMMCEISDMLIEYALEHVEWERNEK